MQHTLPYNTAVRQQRRMDEDSLDFLPTQPWAVRAFVMQILGRDTLAGARVLEPAAGAGDMARALREFTPHVRLADVADYGIRPIDEHPITLRDFLTWTPEEPMDWIITNPPFNKAEEFVLHGLNFARQGVAVLVRSAFLEGIGRYNRLYSKVPPAVVATYVERAPMFVGRLEARKGSATSYSWLLWKKGHTGDTIQKWIIPCRKKLERASDYHRWHWWSHAGLPLPHLRIGEARDIEANVTQALPLLRDPERAVIHQGRFRTAASLIERSANGRLRVLARLFASHAENDPNTVKAELERVLRGRGLELTLANQGALLAA